MVKTIAVLVIAATVSACAPVEGMTHRNTEGQPQDYKEGYFDGCGTGFVAADHPYATSRKDVMRYLGNPVYHTGWDDGFVTCKGQYDHNWF